jgi:hypothetical protein
MGQQAPNRESVSGAALAADDAITATAPRDGTKIRLHHGSEPRGFRRFCTTQTSLFLAIQLRLHQLRAAADRAEKAGNW